MCIRDRELGAQTQALFSEKFPKLSLNLHVSRIYRDARRLHGRGPYKDHLWFTLRPPQADSDGVGPVSYTHLAGSAAG